LRKVKFENDKCTACWNCVIACGLEHSDSKDINRAAGEMPRATARIRIDKKKGKLTLVRCLNCRKAQCIDACPEKAISRNGDGYVLIDRMRCTGCGKCAEACPFGSISIDAGGKALKCDSCLHREVPACVAGCVTGALALSEETGAKSGD
jgi:carbon-monoxide dehydrogenase iron sulfur subunit